jgi:hypothetical protein
MDNEINVIKPAVTPEQAKAVMKEYQDLCLAVLDKNDVQTIQNKEFKKKSAWRKLAKVFNLSLEIVEERSEKLNYNGEDVLVFHFRAKAIAPNGVYSEGAGSCDTSEKGLFKSIHNTRTIAETRAINRAISSLIGSGEVSAEEINEHNGEAPKPQSDGKPAWVVGTCGLCGGELKISKSDSSKYYCSNYKELSCKNAGLIVDLPKE